MGGISNLFKAFKKKPAELDVPIDLAELMEPAVLAPPASEQAADAAPGPADSAATPDETAKEAAADAPSPDVPAAGAVAPAGPENAPPAKGDRAPLLKDYEELPEYEGVLTGTAGALSVPESLRKEVALLSLRDEKALLVSTDAFYGSAQHLSLTARARHIGVTISSSRIVADTAILALIYQKEKRQLKNTGEDGVSKADSVQLFESIIADGVRERATDIHFNIQEETSTVWMRIDGIMRRFKAFPSEMLNEAVGVAYNKMAGETSRSHPAYNSRLSQSCSIALENAAGRSLKLRYQSIPVVGGHKIICRILFTDDGSRPTPTLDMLGYAKSHQHLLELASRKTVGAIVVAGVTGSGKSTTLKALLLMDPERHTWQQYSVEDPAEYALPGVAQVSVQRTAEASSDGASASPFVSAMRTIMRGDPDEIMVGEVRDAETGSLLKTMVQSGHQVYTTVHAASAIEVVERMTSEEIGISRETMSSRNFVSAIAYQRLVALNCPKCKVRADSVYEPSYMAVLKDKFGLDCDKIYAAAPAGCPDCKGRGLKGQTVVAEILAPDAEIQKYIREGRDIEAEEEWRSRRSVGFDHPDCEGKTAFEHGLTKVANGTVDPRVLEDSFEPFETYRIVKRKDEQ